MSDKLQREIQMFGITVDQIRKGVKEAIADPKMIALSILSDAQEVLEMDDKESARQLINRAKMVIMEFTENPKEPVS